MSKRSLDLKHPPLAKHHSVIKQPLQLTEEEKKQIEILIANCMKEASNMPRENIITFKNLYPNQKFKAIH